VLVLTGRNYRAIVLRVLVIPIAVLAGLTIAAIVWPEFVHIPSLLLTLGGALGATYFSYPKRHLCDLLRAIRALFLESHPSIEDQISELSRLTGLYRLQGLKGLESQERLIPDPFLKRGVGMLVDLHTKDRIYANLQKDLARVISQQETSRQILMTLGRLLPSFGLIGTLIGMVLLLRNLSGQDVQALPSALGLAVLTTLYGAVFANAFVAPLASRLHSVSLEKEMQMRLTLDWVVMMCLGEPTAVIANKLGIHLPPAKTNRHHVRDWTTLTLSS
jgi:chemotaxis protein MotA